MHNFLWGCGTLETIGVTNCPKKRKRSLVEQLLRTYIGWLATKQQKTMPVKTQC